MGGRSGKFERRNDQRKGLDTDVLHEYYNTTSINCVGAFYHLVKGRNDDFASSCRFSAVVNAAEMSSLVHSNATGNMPTEMLVDHH
jgi:hypothetical protein